MPDVSTSNRRPSRLRIVAAVAGALIVAIVISLVSRHDVRVRRAGVSLFIVDGEGQPVEGAIASLVWRGAVLRAAADAEGQVSFPEVSAVEVLDLGVLPPTFQLCPYVGRRRFTVGERIVLDRVRSVSGTVQDPRGHPVEGVTLRAIRPDGTETVEIDATGRFEMDLCEPSVVLRASLVSVLRDERSVTKTVLAGSMDVVLTIDPTPVLDVRVVNWPWDAASVMCRLSVVDVLPGAQGSVQKIYTLERPLVSGRVRFPALSLHATYRIFAHLEPSGLYLLETGISATEHEFGLRRGHEIAGTVRLPPTSRPAVVQVDCSCPDLGITVTTRATGEGTFQVRGLPSGAWVVRAWTPASAKGHSGEVRVPSIPATDLSIELK